MAYDDHTRGECSVCLPEIQNVFTGIVTGIAAEQRQRLMNEKCNGSLPTQRMCGWEGHDAAVAEVGWCSVCQHGNHPFPVPE